MISHTPSCVWRATPELITTLQQRFGDPLDTYVNGSQVWLREDGPKETTIEWRLHPVSGYTRPPGQTTESVFGAAAFALATDDTLPAPLDQLWDGLEAFPAYGNDVEPGMLANLTSEALGLRPDAFGLVDHRSIGDRWEKTQGQVSIISLLFEDLNSTP